MCDRKNNQTQPRPSGHLISTDRPVTQTGGAGSVFKQTNMTTVTQAIQAVFRPYADCPDLSWYMQRGTAVHACAAAICQNQQLEEIDERIRGYVSAVRCFLFDFKPVVIEVEKRYYDESIQLSGKPDLICADKKHRIILDWKCGLSGYEYLQLGGYSKLTGIKYGLPVKLNEDGTYKAGEIVDVSKKHQRYFLAALTTYNCMNEIGKLKQQEEVNE